MSRRGYGRDEEDDYAGNTWDRERFERARARSRGASSRYETIRVEEEDRYSQRGGVQEKIKIKVNEDRRRGSGGYSEKDRDEEKSTRGSQRYRRPEFLDDERYAPSGREMEPYRRKEYKEYESVKRSSRPSYGRRQSSLDTYDRRPLPRYEERDEERDRDRGVRERDVNVSINVQAPPPSPPPSVPEPRYREYDYIFREREPERAPTVYSRRERESVKESSHGSEIEDDYVEIETPEPKRKKGKTRMPKRLVHKSALNRMSFPYEEEENFYVVQYALKKDEIDEVIKLSEGYFDDNKTVYKFQETHETKLLEAPSHSSYDPNEPLPGEIIETITRKIIENPTPSDFGENIRSISESDSSSSGSDTVTRRHGAKSVKSAKSGKSGKTSRTHRTSKSKAESSAPSGTSRSKSVRSKSLRSKSVRSRSRYGGGREREEEESEIDLRATAGALILPERSRRKSVGNVDAQIKALEQEKKALRLEREAQKDQREALEKLERAERLRDSEYEIVNGREERRDVVRVEKDKRGRLALVKSSH